MKINNSRLVAAFGSVSMAALLATTSIAQPPEGGPRGQGGGGPKGGRPEGGQGGPGGMRGDPKMIAQMMLEKFDKDGDKMLNGEELVVALTELRQMGGPGGFGGGPGNGGPGGPGGFNPGGFGGGPNGPGGFGGGEMIGRMFTERDKDGDGKLTGDEIPERMRQGMARIDTNGDGSIEKAEMEKMMSNFGGGGGGNRPPRDGQGGDQDNRLRRPAAE